MRARRYPFPLLLALVFTGIVAPVVKAQRGGPGAAPPAPTSQLGIGDLMWSVPTVRLSFPSHIPGATGHHWSSAVAMATPAARSYLDQLGVQYPPSMPPPPGR